SEPSSIPSARKATSAGTPVRDAPRATTMLAVRIPPTTRSIVPTSTTQVWLAAREGPPFTVHAALMRYSAGDPPRAKGAMAADGKQTARDVIAMTALMAAAALLAAAVAAPAPAAGGWRVTAQSTIAGSTPSTATVSGSGYAGRLLIRADSGVRVSVRIRL